jgi:hypothetical protein
MPLSDALQLLDSFLAVAEPRVEGLIDMKATSLSTTMKAAVEKALADTQEITGAAKSARGLIARLVDRGFPALPTVVLEEAQARELGINHAEHLAAMGAFTTKEPAASLNLTGGPEPV